MRAQTLAAALIRQAVREPKVCIARRAGAASDNGAPGMTRGRDESDHGKAGDHRVLQPPGRHGNDNPFSEALFRTCKYRPDWPTKGFATKADAQLAWVILRQLV